MGDYALTWGSRNQRQNFDGLNILPEVILSHILSLLPTKDAVRTSVLSRTWKQRWTTINILDFDDRLHYSSKKRNNTNLFIDFVDNVFLHLKNSTIQDLYLCCFDPKNLLRIKRWINEAISRKVQGIYIRAFAEQPLVFRYDKYDFGSLKELILQIPCTLRVTHATCFSRLKFLHLTRVTLLNECSTSTEIALIFPVLEVLIMERCSFSGVDDVNVDSPLLNSFTLTDSAYRSEKPAKSCVLKINASSLTTLNWIMYSYVSLILVNLSSDLNASIRFSSLLILDHKLKMTSVTRDLFHLIANDVRSLTLSYGTIEVLSCIKGLQDQLPTFSNLVKLNLDLEIQAYSGILTALLKSMPVLETLIFTLGPSSYKVEGEIVPICCLPSLKAIKLMQFHGTKMEIELVKLLIKNAVVLEVMIIVASQDLSSNGRIKFQALKKQMQAFPRGSVDLSIFFI